MVLQLNNISRYFNVGGLRPSNKQIYALLHLGIMALRLHVCEVAPFLCK